MDVGERTRKWPGTETQVDHWRWHRHGGGGQGTREWEEFDVIKGKQKGHESQTSGLFWKGKKARPQRNE